MAAAKKTTPIALSISTPDGDTWTLDLETRQWQATHGEKTFTGRDPMRLASKLDAARSNNIPDKPPAAAAPNTDKSKPRTPDRLAVLVKSIAKLGKPDQASNLEIVHVVNPQEGAHAPHYFTASGERIWGTDRRIVIDPEDTSTTYGLLRSIDGLLRSIALSRADELADKPARAATRHWWTSKEPTVDPAAHSSQAISSLWPSAEPSKQAWEPDGKGGARLGRATISLKSPHAYAGYPPAVFLSYEGMGEVMRTGPEFIDIALHAGAVMHAAFGDNPPTEGVKTWVARQGWEKNAQDKPVQVEVALSTVLNIPSSRGPDKQTVSLLTRSSNDGSWRWRPVPLDRGAKAPDVRAYAPGDEVFLGHARDIMKAADAVFSTPGAPWSGKGGYRARSAEQDQEMDTVPALTIAPGATAEIVLDTAAKWLEDIGKCVDSHPSMKIFRETCAPLRQALCDHLESKPEQAVAAKRKATRRQ